jgi:hypothetical protein
MKLDDDPTWKELEDAAARLNPLSDDTIEVRAHRSRSLRKVVEGLWAGDLWTDYWQPVRWRRPSSTEWHQVGSVAEAAAGIEWFLRERPDRRSFGEG